MGILKAISNDVEELILQGYSDDYIERSVGVDKSTIQYMLSYLRKELKTKEGNINKKSVSKKGEKDGLSHRFRNP